MERVNDLLRRKKSKIIIFMILDIISMLIASYLALALRFDFDEIPAQYLTTAYKYVAIDIAVMLITFFELNLYTSVWRYASITELINIGSACFTTEIINLIYKKMFSISMPRSYSLIRLLLLIFFVATIRFSFRILRTITIKFENKKLFARYK